MITIKEQAEILAQANEEENPNIQNIYWFRDEKEIRLLVLIPDVPTDDDEIIRQVYIYPSKEGVYVPAKIAIIRPEEFGKLTLPDNWGTWEDAIELL